LNRDLIKFKSIDVDWQGNAQCVRVTVAGGKALSEFSDRAEYEKYRAEMLEKLRQPQETRPDKQPAASKITAGRPKTGRRTFGGAVTIVSFSFVGIGLAVLLFLIVVITPPADKENPQRTSFTSKKNAEKSIQDMTPGGGKIGGSGAEEGEVQAPQTPWKLGFEKGREIAGVFLTNKQRLKQKKCPQAMLKTEMGREDYLRGCLERYDSLVRAERSSR
jgi:hypothetical protein